MFTLILSIACAAGAGCDYKEYKIVEVHDRGAIASMCKALSTTLTNELSPKEKDNGAMFRCLDTDDPKNEGRKIYVDNSTETSMLIELCPLDERSGRFKRKGSPDCKFESVATFYGPNASKLCANRVNYTQPMYAFKYDTRSFDGHLSCLTTEPESDAL